MFRISESVRWSLAMVIRLNVTTWCVIWQVEATAVGHGTSVYQLVNASKVLLLSSSI